MTGWTNKRLGKLVDITSSKRIFYEDYVSSGIPFYRSKEVIERANNKRTVSTELFITKKKYEDIKDKFGVPILGDMLLTSVGTLGIPYIVQEGEIFYFKDGNLTWFRNFTDALLNTYLRYWIISSIGRETLNSIAIGSTQPALTIIGLKNIELALPDPKEQKAIASVLSSLDDKIDLLHRQNATLEAMAEALFRQWFVVEAKEEWEEQPLLHHIHLVGGGTPKTSVPEYWNGSIPWLSGGDIVKNHKTFAFASEKNITEEGVACSSAKLLPQYATVITARGSVGKFCLLGKPMAYSQTNYGILPKNSEMYFFTFLLIEHIVKELQTAAYGSVFDTITTQTFEETSIALPKMNKMKNFDLLVRVYFEKMFANQTQIRTLEKLRDTLLPKLMSGEVRVNDAEKFAEATI